MFQEWAPIAVPCMDWLPFICAFFNSGVIAAVDHSIAYTNIMWIGTVGVDMAEHPTTKASVLPVVEHLQFRSKFADVISMLGHGWVRGVSFLGGLCPVCRWPWVLEALWVVNIVALSKS